MPIKIFNAAMRKEAREMKRKFVIAKRQMEFDFIIEIEKPDQLQAYIHRNNTMKILLAIKIFGVIVGAIISPTVGFELIKSFFGG